MSEIPGGEETINPRKGEEGKNDQKPGEADSNANYPDETVIKHNINV